MIAVLFVETDGVYYGLPNVDPWDKARDARLYAGPHRIIAHPPCERWGRYWSGGPSAKVRRLLGDDDGKFASAISAVRKWGGVLEHPEGSHAWRHFHLNTPPRNGGWIVADFDGGWTCCVEQGAYGHRARKATWLYAFGLPDLPSLRWGAAPGDFMPMDAGFHSAEERRQYQETGEATPYIRRAIKTGICQRLSKKQRAATPIPFRDMLIALVEQRPAEERAA